LILPTANDERPTTLFSLLPCLDSPLPGVYRQDLLG
jgi:hypothetical protein